MNECSIDDVVARFSEAVETGRRLPPVRVQGYFNVWPVFARKEWEGFADKDYQYRPLPPTPEAIDRMLETMRWVQWLDEEQRHLIVSFRQACMKSIDILANVSCEFNPTRSAADGREGEGRASWGAWREPEAGSGAVQTLA